MVFSGSSYGIGDSAGAVWKVTFKRELLRFGGKSAENDNDVVG